MHTSDTPWPPISEPTIVSFTGPLLPILLLAWQMTERVGQEPVYLTRFPDRTAALALRADRSTRKRVYGYAASMRTRTGAAVNVSITAARLPLATYQQRFLLDELGSPELQELVPSSAPLPFQHLPQLPPRAATLHLVVASDTGPIADYLRPLVLQHYFAPDATCVLRLAGGRTAWYLPLGSAFARVLRAHGAYTRPAYGLPLAHVHALPARQSGEQAG